ncbi:mucin-2 [Lingula anatina]|uniref:Mucin-2 n=1 Tax=Lingula anatina TaxID=7574 RepID=A0A1S3H865_LINAN|nr:mucin-2 [Lingula anatina]XP_013382172.1 mucin-2 [Lingula anatina]|eukprot:XP_013382171.1 mucin-2 [Lingula anatina]
MGNMGTFFCLLCVLTFTAVDLTVLQSDDRCIFNGHRYRQGETWSLDCMTSCRCVRASMNATMCYSRCATYQSLPAGCRLEVKAGECCPKPVCDWMSQCIYKGRGYDVGEKWDDGCDYSCECLKSQWYSCHERCPKYLSIPPHCALVAVPGKCCKEVKCGGSILPGNNFGTTPDSNTTPKPTDKTSTSPAGSSNPGIIKTTAKVPGSTSESSTTALPSSVTSHSTATVAPSRTFLPTKSVSSTSAPQVFVIPTKIPGLSSCQDKLRDCSDYVDSACFDRRYRPWALRNCAQTCGLCSTNGGNSAGQPCAFPFQYKGSNVTQCIVSGHSEPWCAVTENFDRDGKWGNCHPSMLNRFCKNALPDCYLYGKNACIGGFTEWGKTNCAAYCGYCGAGHTNPGFTKTPSGVSSSTAVVTPSSKVTSATVPTTTATPVSKTAAPTFKSTQRLNVTSLPPSTSASTSRSTPVVTVSKQPKRTTTATTQPMTTQRLASSTAAAPSPGPGDCVYGGKTYKDGETWNDGCAYRCKCVLGYHTCNKRCPGLIDWIEHLPAGCTLGAPPVGKCCPAPVCPPGVNVSTWPKNYVP